MTPVDLPAWRDRLGWNQAEAARQLGMARTHLAEIESGRRRPTAKRWRVIELAALALEKLPDTRLPDQVQSGKI